MCGTMRGTMRGTMCGTLRTGVSLALLAIALAAVRPTPAEARERLLHCATSSVTARPGHHQQRFAQHRFYAPVNSAMFFSRAGSVCRWKTMHRRRG